MHVKHILRKRDDGVIYCEGCTLNVFKPAGIPDYSKALMKEWDV